MGVPGLAAVRRSLTRPLKRSARRIARSRGVRRARIAAFRRLRPLAGLPVVRPARAAALPGGGLFVAGVLVDPGRRLESLSCVLADGARLPLDAPLERWRDPHAKLYGSLLPAGAPTHFAARTAAGAPTGASPDAPPVALELGLRGGRTRRVALGHVVPADDALGAVRAVLRSVPARLDGKRALFDRLYGPVVESIWSARPRGGAGAPDVVEHNAHLACAAPRTTLVVPIYGRHDFIEYQLARFANDPSLAADELLYVIDDPRIGAEVRASCEQLARIYRIPFRVAHLSANLGYAGANNAGVALARGEHVLLLNSDVLPVAPGWLDAMHACAPPDALVGARLLYEDGSVQHDGMRFFEDPFLEGLWTNVHPAKGLPAGSLPAREAATPREAVTGACLLLARRTYLALGGLDERFVLGDFEDSDLCLAAHAAGHPVVLAETVSLWHLERQSQDLAGDAWKRELTYYNCWAHARARDADVRALKARGAGDGDDEGEYRHAA